MNRLKYLLFLILIVGFGSIFENFYSRFVQIIELLVIVLLLINKKTVKFKGSYREYLFIIYLCVLLSMVFTGSSITDYTSLLLRPIFAILILAVFDYKYDNIKFYFKKVLWAIAWLAAVNWFLVSFFPGLFRIAISSSGFQINTIFYVFNYLSTAYTERFGIGFYRNQGIFWEPGVLEIMMNILVYIELFEYREKIKKIFLPAIIIISTSSTSGYILFAALLGLRYYEQLKIGKGFKKKFSTILAAVFIIGSFTPLLINEIAFKTSTGVDSANMRQYDMLMGLAIIKDNPIFGIGPNKNRYIAETNKYQIIVGENVTYDTRASSNVFTTLFASFGIPFALLFIFSLYRQNIFTKKKFFFIIIFVGLMSEPVVFVDLYFLWIMSGTYKPKNSQMLEGKVGGIIIK